VYSFARGTVNAATSGAVTLTVKVNSTLPAGLRAITNTAGIETTTPGDDVSDNQTQDVDVISTVPALDLTAVFTSVTPYPTKRITYTLRYTNTSAMNTTGVVITATKSQFVTLTGSGWTWTGITAPDGRPIYTRTIGSLAAGASGNVNFITILPYPFTFEMDSFDNDFLIQDNGPGGLPPASDIVTTVLGVPDVVVESVTFSPAAVSPGELFTATVTIRNEGTGRACNPDTFPCGPLSVDVFVDPITPTISFPFDPYWDDFEYVSQIDPGQARIATFTNLSFTTTNDFILYFKVDNWDCTLGTPCIPDSAQHGLVPESDEYNNVLMVQVPVALTNKVYLPLIMTSN
jgi:hypothetical protein